MNMTVDFAQPENGKLNMGSSGKQDMVFQFSGDDDVLDFYRWRTGTGSGRYPQ